MKYGDTIKFNTHKKTGNKKKYSEIAHEQKKSMYVKVQERGNLIPRYTYILNICAHIYSVIDEAEMVCRGRQYQ